MMKFWLLTIISLVNFTTPLVAQELNLLSEEDINEYLATVRELDTLDANYIQNKQIDILNRQLKSEGRFIYIKDRGIAWHLKSPFELVTVIKKTEFYQLDESFNRMPDQANSDRVAPILSQIFSIFSGDIKPLKKKFQIYGERNDKEWTLKLVPNDEITKTIIEDIVIKGNRFIEAVVVHNQNGDETSIHFSEIKENSQTVTKNELIFFTK